VRRLDPVVLISVVICTVDREEMARKTVDSVLGQSLDSETGMEIVVVDNSGGESAHPWVSAHPAFGEKLRYVHERAAGISHARNAGIAAARGAYVAFIDDDEVAKPDWLKNLYRAMIEHDADVATGPVFPVFEDRETLGWDPEPFIFSTHKAMPTGHRVQFARGGNVMFRPDRCFDVAPPFDPELGLSGGEDTQLIYRLHLQGRKIIWVADAVVHEFWPNAKAMLPAFLHRKLISARNSTYVHIVNDRNPLIATLRIGAKALVQLAIFAPLAALSAPFGRQSSARFRMHVMSALGKITYWKRARYYGSAGEAGA